MLVGHSGGGGIAHAAVDARPDRVARVVYVDSWPLGDGDAINDGFPAENGEFRYRTGRCSTMRTSSTSMTRCAAFRERAVP